MTSSRASSPASNLGSISPVQLTPRSKVNAMLAALDDDSDDTGAKTSINLNFLSKDTTNLSDAEVESKMSLPFSNASDTDDEDEIVAKPRGRLAGKMVTGESDVDECAEDDTARARVRRMLLAENKKSPKASTVETNVDESDDEDTPVVSRKRKARAGSVQSTHRSTPRPTTPRTDMESFGGLFVSPVTLKSASPMRNLSASEDELPTNPNENSKFLALVKKKREERLAKEAEQIRQRENQRRERSKLAARHADILDEDEVDMSDDDVGRQLTQQVRPTRKASKKALEEMHRETQRISRNMQLAHEARTRKKITKSSLFARFNYKPEGFVEENAVQNPVPASSSSAPHSEGEIHDTPPTSPASQTDDITKDLGLPVATLSYKYAEMLQDNEDEVIPTLEDALSSQSHIALSPLTLAKAIGKGKDKATKDIQLPVTNKAAPEQNKSTFTQHLIRVRVPPIIAPGRLDDSESDLEIIAPKTPLRKSKKDSIFDRLPNLQARESHSLHALRMLARVTSPGKHSTNKNSKPSMTASELSFSLQQRARQQAVREREERLQDLRARGVIVQTAEEREKEVAEVEDMISKARREGEEIAKGEKDAAKRERKANGEADLVDEDSSDDEEWVEEKERFAEQMSSFGSDDDDAGGDGDVSNEEFEDEDEDEENNVAQETEDEDEMSLDELGPLSKLRKALIDNEASDTDNEDGVNTISADEGEEHFVNDIDEEDEVLPVRSSRRMKHMNTISDDEDEEIVMQSPAVPHTDSPVSWHNRSPTAPPSVLRSATKTFIPGLTVVGPAGLGLTQIFAGTMDDSQTQPIQGLTGSDIQESIPAPDPMAFLRNISLPNLPEFEPTLEDHSQVIIRDSQTQISHIPESQFDNGISQGIELHFTQSQIHGFDSLVEYPSATQFSDFPDATQDAGFQAISPIKGRFAEPPPSTVDTVLLETTPAPQKGQHQIEATPVVKMKGKLRRRTEIPVLSDDEDTPAMHNNLAADDEDFEISANIFDVMRKASKKKDVIEDFDKKKSGAKEMVHEQAEESEDEYAGLGGASDDESVGEEDAFVKDMIDDEGPKGDESKLAAFYADKERASDEKQVEKLFKDITNGMLRRKRGADYDLSDSDDDGEARRQMKRKEFAKMRKALLEDERIGKIAENPKKLAFLRAIEDRGENDDVDFLDDFQDSQDSPESQTQSQGEGQEVTRVEDSQPDEMMGPPKRKLHANADQDTRLPPHLRRTAANRPSNLSEIRESLSSLIDEPNSLASHEASDSDSEPENDEGGPQKEKENRDPFAPRRTSSSSIVDRISLKRANSSKTSSTTRLAFAVSSSGPGFKVPALLRRATTNSSITSGSSASSVLGTERIAGGFGDDKGFVKKAGKNSGVHYFARENERKLKVQEGEKRREQKRFKGAEGRRKAVGGLFGMGKFE